MEIQSITAGTKYPFITIHEREYLWGSYDISFGIKIINDELEQLEKENKLKDGVNDTSRKACQEYVKEIFELRNENEQLKKNNEDLTKYGFKYDELNREHAVKIDAQQRIENSLQSEITRLRRENKQQKQRIEDLESAAKSALDSENHIYVYGGEKYNWIKDPHLKNNPTKCCPLIQTNNRVTFNHVWIDEANEVPKETLYDMLARYSSIVYQKAIELKAVKESLQKGEIPKFKIQVTPEQSEYVQKWIFANGGKWLGYQNTSVSEMCMPYLFTNTQYDNTLTWGYSDNHNTSPEITFDQFKEWAKPIKEYTEDDFPCLTVIRNIDGKNIVIGEGIHKQMTLADARKTPMYYYDKNNKLHTTDLGNSCMSMVGDFTNNVCVIATTIDKLKVGDWWMFANSLSDSNMIMTYNYLKHIKNDIMDCTYIYNNKEKTSKYRCNSYDKSYKFELK